MNQNSIELLSDRENEIALHLTLGKSEKQIANALFVSPHTVRNHLATIRKKLDAHCAVDVVRTYILSIDNPKSYFSSITFLLLQVFIIFNINTQDLRKPRRAKSRTKTHINVK